MPSVSDIPQPREGDGAGGDLAVIDRVLLEAVDLAPVPGYINGDDYGEWYVQASSSLLKALAALAVHRDCPELATRLKRYSGPMRLEVFVDSETNLEVCTTAVAEHETPCPRHSPENGSAFGRCAYKDPAYLPHLRMCKRAPAEGSDRCAPHDALWRVVKENGEVCGNWNCCAPAHRKARATSPS